MRIGFQNQTDSETYKQNPKQKRARNRSKSINKQTHLRSNNINREGSNREVEEEEEGRRRRLTFEISSFKGKKTRWGFLVGDRVFQAKPPPFFYLSPLSVHHVLLLPFQSLLK